MPTSKNRKGHAQKSAKRSQKIKSDRENFRRKLINEFIAGQRNLEEYKTSEDVDIDIDTTGLELDSIEVPELVTESESVQESTQES